MFTIIIPNCAGREPGVILVGTLVKLWREEEEKERRRKRKRPKPQVSQRSSRVHQCYGAGEVMLIRLRFYTIYSFT